MAHVNCLPNAQAERPAEPDRSSLLLGSRIVRRKAAHYRLYSRTSSARARIDGGIVRPSAPAVLRLMIR
jgi:hypothetical protein